MAGGESEPGCLEYNGCGVFPGFGAAANQKMQPSPCVKANTSSLTQLQTPSPIESLHLQRGAPGLPGCPSKRQVLKTRLSGLAWDSLDKNNRAVRIPWQSTG